MRIEVMSDPGAVAKRAASVIAEHARAAFAARGRFVAAFSGGYTPHSILRMLGREEVPWGGVYVFQVHERLFPMGSPEGDLPELREVLMEESTMDPCQIYAMPTGAEDPEQGAATYAYTLQNVAGNPPILDLVHLGLFADGHTAALFLGDRVLEETRDVAVTGPQEGRKRITLTVPLINRARSILWVVTGSDKARALFLLESGDPAIPASGIRTDTALVLADQAAAGEFEGPLFWSSSRRRFS
jgi:6-phosphogluconolactonase